MFRQLSINSSRGNANITAVLAELYNIKRVVASVYYLQAQGFIERGYKLIVNALAKIDSL